MRFRKLNFQKNKKVHIYRVLNNCVSCVQIVDSTLLISKPDYEGSCAKERSETF